MMYIVFLFLATFNFVYSENTPVLLWGSQSDLKPSLNILPEQEFKDIVLEKLRKSMIVVFLEHELSSQDLAHCRIDSGEACYSNITRFSPVTYYANVEHPFTVLHNLDFRKEYVNADFDGQLNYPVTYEVGKLIFISFKDEGEDRASMLHKHDAIISKTYEDLSALGKIVALYTSSTPTNLIRKIRQAMPTESPKHFSLDNKFLIYYSGLGTEEDNTIKPIDITSAKLQNSTATSFEVELNGGSNKITFLIQSFEGYWSLRNLHLNDQEFRVNPAIVIPEDFSYYCGNATFLSNNIVIHWNSLQMQAYFPEHKDLVFGDPWHCVGFTSPGIWAGLFVSFMLLGILSIGISWMMDIKTMDRFDDPKGKTITVNVSE